MPLAVWRDHDEGKIHDCLGTLLGHDARARLAFSVGTDTGASAQVCPGRPGPDGVEGTADDLVVPFRADNGRGRHE